MVKRRMTKQNPTPKAILPQIQTEIDAGFLYGKLADAEEDAGIAAVYRELSAIEQRHADKIWQYYNLAEIKKTLPPPSWRARILNLVGKVFGYDYVLATLMDLEKSLAVAEVREKQKYGQTPIGVEDNHLRLLKALQHRHDGMSGQEIAKLEGRHKTVGGNALRAAVLGANDGLVSNLSLVMGVAGATQGENGVLLVGIAGLMAGSLSMALGEWISVKSSQELYERQMDLEMLELLSDPEGEQRELAMIYEAKGIPRSEAARLATETMSDSTKAHQVLVQEELGIQADELKGSAWEAAIASFMLFAVGAIIPVIPFFWMSGLQAIIWSAIAGASGLFLIGAAITVFTGKSVFLSGFRQVLFGLAAALVTFVIGRLIGVSLV